MRRRWRRGLTFLAAGLVLLGVTLPATADPDPVATPVPGHELAITPQDAAAVVAFWTADRMLAAEPMDLLTVDVPPERRHLLPGTPAVVPPTPAVLAYPSHGDPWAGGGAVAKTAGRVFFTYQGRQASCSGNAVTSENKSVVVTAGHCVRMEGNWHADWVFVPGYDNGNAPLGTWPARQLFATPQWVDGEDLNFDVGAGVVNQVEGRGLTDAAGGQGIAFNQPREQDMYAFGYPAAEPYDGSKLIHCSGKVFNDFLFSDDLGMTCNMTGGSSGGPWFLTFDEAAGTGVQNSVNSFKYRLLSFWMFGPYFGNEAQAVFDTAQKA